MLGLKITVHGSSSDDPQDALVYNPRVSYTGIRIEIDTGIIWHKVTEIDLIQYGMPEAVNRASFVHDRDSLYVDRIRQDAVDRDFTAAILAYAETLTGTDRVWWYAKANEWGTAIRTWTVIRFSPFGAFISEAV